MFNFINYSNYYDYYEHFTLNQIVTYMCVYVYIQGVPGGMDKTSGECSLC